FAPGSARSLTGKMGTRPLNPSLFFTAADSGFYLAIVSSFSGNAPGGAYTLTMSAMRISSLDVQDAGEPREGESAQGGYNEPETK
ncbi:hypothetical protein, partial [Candidatus Entotheonella palauensis]|uniref:hypothetical protein n=1 Tax=Candidatus Entotheonella palauensis TaxID=93172 RepID=UPI001C4E1018